MLNKAPPDAAPAMRDRDRQMMQVSAPAIVPAEHGSDKLATRRFRDGTQAGVTPKESRHTVLRVGFAEANSLASLPKGYDALVIGNVHCANMERDFARGGIAFAPTPRRLIR